MRLYHWRIEKLGWIGLIISLFVFLAGCSPPQITQALVVVNIYADQQVVQQELPAGSSVEQALEKAGVTLGPLDRVEPPEYTLLQDGSEVRVVRIREEFEVEEAVIPFEVIKQPTELLTEGVEQLDPLQQGENGLREVTYRILYEDGREVSRTVVKTVVLKEPLSQIQLIGVKPISLPGKVPGRLAYLYNRNAWLIEGETTQRRRVVETSDLDGRVFRLSQDGSRLLFTRDEGDENVINTLWVADLTQEPVELFDLGVENIIHFADWVPGSNSKVVFSTVETRATAPGWQANNDLYALSFSPSGWVSRWRDKPILEANAGGIYGWWGTDFAWGPSGVRLAYSRPDGVGVVDFNSGLVTQTASIIPLQTGGDWAWVPGVNWAPDESFLFTVDHRGAEDSQSFHLAALPTTGGPAVNLVPQTGMFAYPVASPLNGDGLSQNQYSLAYLQAIFPNQSETSRYRLVVMDRDGSNTRVIFPDPGEPGLEPQNVVWSPVPVDDGGKFVIALVYQGNLWLVDPLDGRGNQVTGDSLTSRISWVGVHP